MAKKSSKPTVILPDAEEIETLNGEIGPLLEMGESLASDDNTFEEVETAPHPEKPSVQVPVSSKNISDLASRIAPAGSARDWRQRWLIYGMNKTGKTNSLNDPKTLIANIEMGDTTLTDKPVADRALQAPTMSKDDFEALYWFLYNSKRHESGRGLVVKTSVGERHIDTLAFDTVTRLKDKIIRSIVLGARATDSSIVIDRITIQQHGDAGTAINHWMTLFRDLPLHIVWVCQERLPGEDGDGSLGIPDLPKSVRNFLQGDADVIGRTYKKTNDEGRIDYRMYFGPTEEYVTGDRYKVLPAGIKDPSIRKVMTYIEKKRTAISG